MSRRWPVFAVFYNLLGLYAVFAGFAAADCMAARCVLVDGLAAAAGWGAALSGVVALYFMQRIYRIPARPYWDHWQVLTSFYGSWCSVGCSSGSGTAVLAIMAGSGFAPTLAVLALPVCGGLLLEILGVATCP